MDNMSPSDCAEDIVHLLKTSSQRNYEVSEVNEQGYVAFLIDYGEGDEFEVTVRKVSK